jgi:pantoate--beta-alanine ligase
MFGNTIQALRTNAAWYPLGAGAGLEARVRSFCGASLCCAVPVVVSLTMPTATHHYTQTALTVARSTRTLRDELDRLRALGAKIAFVPTMGALHEGHLSLVRRAAQDGHAVCLSIFVNPTQFAPTEDLASYPRDEACDLALAADAGATVAFCPTAGEVYPEGFATSVIVDGPSRGLEGAVRPHHFAGVATVVAKLLLTVRPDRVVFGQKDAQQVAVIRRMMADLHLDDIELVIGKTVREADGLAMSSRNAYLSADDRSAATVLIRALTKAEHAVRSGVVRGSEIEEAAMSTLAAEPRCAPDYVTLVDRASFAPLDRLDVPATLCIAARIGTTRLIDNITLDPPNQTQPED